MTMTERKILIVEDEIITARLLKIKLGKIGYNISGPVASGNEAIEKALEEPPFAVLMDIHLMGEIDGIEL